MLVLLLLTRRWSDIKVLSCFWNQYVLCFVSFIFLVNPLRSGRRRQTCSLGWRARWSVWRRTLIPGSACCWKKEKRQQKHTGMLNIKLFSPCCSETALIRDFQWYFCTAAGSLSWVRHVEMHFMCLSWCLECCSLVSIIDCCVFDVCLPAGKKSEELCIFTKAWRTAVLLCFFFKSRKMIYSFVDFAPVRSSF